MNDQQIVLSLISFYKKEGIDLHHLLDNPIFTDLPLQSKIDAIRQHAEEMKQGIHSGFTKHDMKAIGRGALIEGIMGGMAGAAAAATTAKLFTGGKVPPMAIALAAASGLGAGAVLPFFVQNNQRKQRVALKDYLGHAAATQDPSDALNVLAKRHLQATQAKDADPRTMYGRIIDKIYDSVDSRARDQAVKETVRSNTFAGRPMINGQ